jgi:hypothetical protein
MKYKNNHFVPEFYLKSFSVIHRGDRTPKLWAYDKESEEPRKQSPKNTANINNLYTVSAPGVASTDLEIAFGKQESGVAPILAKWQKPGARPEVDEISEVAYFLALLHLRNPKSAKFFEAMAEVIGAERAKAIASDDVRFDKFWQWFLAKETEPPRITKEHFRKLAFNFDENFTIKFDTKYTTLSPLAYADAINNELKKMCWCLCSAPKERNFITSDFPVVVRFGKGKNFAFGGGFGHPTAQVTFPISPKVCLYLSRTYRRKAVLVDSSFVKEANRRMVINAERYIFASQLSEGIEKLVKKYSYTRQLPRLDKAEVIENMRKRKPQQSHPSLSKPD